MQAMGSLSQVPNIMFLQLKNIKQTDLIYVPSNYHSPNEIQYMQITIYLQRYQWQLLDDTSAFSQ